MLTKFKYNIPFELDSPERTIAHRKIIQEKLYLRKLYLKWYKIFTDRIADLPDGEMVELGSGGGFLKEIEPAIICTDILELPSNDLTFSALDMPFDDGELSAIFMIDTFHHIPDSQLFLREVSRVLKSGGRLVMVEPANSIWGRFIYQNFHHEPFDPEGDWSIPLMGPLSGANGALLWIVFERDRKRFEELFPELIIEEMKYSDPLTYLLSGGVSYKQLMPDFMYGCNRVLNDYKKREEV